MKSKLDKIVELLSELEKIWVDDLMLFADNGSLLLIKLSDDKLVIAEFPGIPYDGGDASTYYIRKNEYLDIDKF